MSDVNITPIEEKKKEKKGKSRGKENNYVAFLKDILKGLIMILILSLIGANFIFLTSSFKFAPLLFDALFPKNIDYDYYGIPVNKPKNGQSGVKKSMTGGGLQCDGSYYNEEKLINWDLLKRFGIDKNKNNANNFPYSSYEGEKAEDYGSYSWGQNNINWLVKSMALTNIITNKLFGGYLASFSCDPPTNKNILSNELFQMFMSLITLGCTGILSLGVFCVSLFSLFKNGWIRTLLSWCGFLGFVPFLVMFLQMFKYMFTLTLLPLLADYKHVVGIIARNWKSLTTLFMGYVYLSADTYLNDTSSYTILICYIVLLYKMYKS